MTISLRPPAYAVVAAVAAALAVGPAAPASASPIPVAPSVQVAAAPAAVRAASPVTRITIKMARCEGCTVGAKRWLMGGTPRHLLFGHDFGTARVRHGVAVLRVQSRYTRGLAFEFGTPDGRGSGNAVPVAVLRYGGTRAGSTVTTSRALASRTGSWCWAGTTRTSATFTFVAYRYTDTTMPAVYAKGISVWSRTSLPVLARTFQQTWRGGLGHQDEPYCG